MDKGYVVVDEQFRTNLPNVSAIGRRDHLRSRATCNLAHLSTAEGIALADGSPARTSTRSTTTTCRSAPTATRDCSVGLTEKQAKDAATTCRVGTFNFGVLGGPGSRTRPRPVKIVAEKSTTNPRIA